MAVTLRPVTPDDHAFLFEVYAASRLPELDPVPWSDDQKRAFLRFQFDAQHQDYRTRFADADFHVILNDGTPVGRLYIDRRADEIRILDLALLPPHRGRGLGTAVVHDLLDEAKTTGKSVRIYVEHYQQAARRLFEQLGFEQTEDHGLSVLMAWTPKPAD